MRKLINREVRFHSIMERLEQRALMSAGDIDPTFGIGGRSVADISPGDHEQAYAFDVVNGRIVVGGTVDVTDANAAGAATLAVFDSNGNALNSFSGDGKLTHQFSVPGGILDLVVQSDNKILVLAGREYAESGQTVLARFNADGSIDKSFGGGDGEVTLTGKAPFALALAPGNKAVVATTIGDKFSVTRFTTAGSIEAQSVASVPTGALLVNDVHVQSDGQILVTGYVNEPTEWGTFQDASIVRFRQNLSGLDMTFGGGDGIVAIDGSDATYDNFDFAGTVTTDKKGRILAAIFLDSGDSSVQRFLSNGSVDPTFTVVKTPYGGPSSSVSVAADGKIVISGSTYYSGMYISRLNVDGGFDSTFGTNGTIRGNNDYADSYSPAATEITKVQPDGKILSVQPYSNESTIVYRIAANSSTPVAPAPTLSNGVLKITGTDTGNDDIQIAEYEADYNVYVNGKRTRFSRSQITRVEINTLGGNDRVYQRETSFADARPRRIDGGKGNDELHGGGGADTLLGLDGNDKLYGEGGTDLLDGGIGTDLIDGGLGADTVDYSYRTSALFVDLAGTADDGPKNEKDTVMPSIEHIWGGKGNDILIGDDRANYIRGNGGDDTISGRGGNDTLVGDAGKDKLYGDAGDDFLDSLDAVIDGIVDGGQGTDTAKKDKNDPLKSIELLA